MDDLITIFSSNSAVDCYIIKGRLETERIECYIFDENIVSANPFYANAIGGVKVKIREEQRAKAEEILNQHAPESEEPDTASGIEEENLDDTYSSKSSHKNICIHCPECGSDNVYYGSAIDYKWNIPYLILSFLASVPFPLFRKKYHCFDCNANFKTPVIKKENDSHINTK